MIARGIVFVLLVSVAISAFTEQMRKAQCSSATDCVNLKTPTSRLRLDDLDFDQSTVADIERLMPSWFGPPRPVLFIHRGRKLSRTLTLGEQKLPLAAELEIVEASPGDL